MKKLLLFASFVFTSFCTRKPEMIGVWKVNDYNLWELGIGYFNGARGYLLGTEIHLKPDSTYYEKSCGGHSIGKWMRNNDSLVLKAKRTWYAKPKLHMQTIDPNYDSLAGEIVNWRITYLINGNRLIKYTTMKSLTVSATNKQKKPKIFIEVLKRVESDSK